MNHPSIEFLTGLLKKRFAFLFIPLSILIFNGIVKALDWIYGDANGFISGEFGPVIFNFNIFLGFTFIFALWYKSKRTLDLQINKPLMVSMIAIALFFRLSLAFLGHNYDFESFEIVADIILKGQSVYEHTDRYNYGPVWAYLLAGIKWISMHFSNTQKSFHLFIVVVLFLAELSLYYQVYQTYRNKLMLLILLFNPVSMILIGHHSQFDVIAISLAYKAYTLFERKHILQAVLWMGMSYCTKHIMVFFPLILLFNQNALLKDRLLMVCVPAFMFFISFMPFYHDIQRINSNVFGYQFNSNQTFLKQFAELLIPVFILKMKLLNILPVFKGIKLIWLCLFPAAGYLIQKYQVKNDFLIYLILIVACSPAISEQYFFIPIAAVVFFRKYLFSWLYLAASSYYILFVSYHNTSKYFNLKTLGIGIDYEGYQIGFAQVQICLVVLLIQIFLEAILKVKRLQNSI